MDSRLYRTLVQLFRYPGALTVAFAEGKRKPYLTPVQLFLLANVAYFLLQPLSTYTSYITPLESHVYQQVYADVLAVGDRVEQAIASSDMSRATFTAVFNQRSEILAKALVFAMVPLFALFIGLLTIGSRRLAVDHVTFALHYFAFELIAVHSLFLMFWPRLLVWVGTALVGPPAASVDSTVWQAILWLIEFGAIVFITAPYLFFATRSVYGISKVRAVVITALATVSLFVTIIAYRVLLLFATLLTVN